MSPALRAQTQNPFWDECFPAAAGTVSSWHNQDVVDLFVPGGSVTSPWGMRDRGMHRGIDIVGLPDVRAGVNGVVVAVVTGEGTYNTVKIRTPDGHTIEMMHFGAVSVSKGDEVTPMSIVGRMGGSGPEGPHQFRDHLHLQIRDPKGNLVDPLGAYDWSRWLGPPGVPICVLPPLRPWVSRDPTAGNAG